MFSFIEARTETIPDEETISTSQIAFAEALTPFAVGAPTITVSEHRQRYEQRMKEHTGSAKIRNEDQKDWSPIGRPIVRSFGLRQTERPTVAKLFQNSAGKTEEHKAVISSNPNNGKLATRDASSSEEEGSSSEEEPKEGYKNYRGTFKGDGVILKGCLKSNKSDHVLSSNNKSDHVLSFNESSIVRRYNESDLRIFGIVEENGIKLAKAIKVWRDSSNSILPMGVFVTNIKNVLKNIQKYDRKHKNIDCAGARYTVKDILDTFEDLFKQVGVVVDYLRNRNKRVFKEEGKYLIDQEKLDKVHDFVYKCREALDKDLKSPSTLKKTVTQYFHAFDVLIGLMQSVWKSFRASTRNSGDDETDSGGESH